MFQRFWFEIVAASAGGVTGTRDRSLFDRAWSSVAYHLEFYKNFLLDQWHDMTPMKYGALLVLIGVFGWLLMKNGPKRV
ncbi:MAG: hypothetical protein WD069_15000 [Planctomycetales bacterium]